ncbi:uncharacterized protein LOC122630050 isoform X2 [Vespula pensylvanica]|uniref:uncharacterized protein LOC122630050 isoform X2 n=1 Tax=Vespula pensylvanica TaxID=30213 RepID=UPI001CBA21D6|nr:uncharacterized protein LOC122630050 isoform X2 [Vespula pensylvanica]XP_050851827.1 uncharacterized protein LOC127064598 isoform X2 [Vespula vulgaris]
MDWQNEENDYFDDNFSWNESNFLSRTKSEVSLAGTLGRSVSSKEVQVSFINCKESKSFTSAFEQLDLDVNSKDSTELVQRTCDVQTDPLYDHETENMITGFQTREIPSFRLVIQGPEILKFQGTKYASKDIARYWKKDSRMWLWKSGQRANNQQQPEHSTHLCISEQNFKRFQ